MNDCIICPRLCYSSVTDTKKVGHLMYKTCKSNFCCSLLVIFSVSFPLFYIVVNCNYVQYVILDISVLCGMTVWPSVLCWLHKEKKSYF